MNKCEEVVLDKMVSIRTLMRSTKDGRQLDAYWDTIATLLDCICEWRNPQETPVEDGCGAMVGKVEK